MIPGACPEPATCRRYYGWPHLTLGRWYGCAAYPQLPLLFYERKVNPENWGGRVRDACLLVLRSPACVVRARLRVLIAIRLIGGAEVLQQR